MSKAYEGSVCNDRRALLRPGYLVIMKMVAAGAPTIFRTIRINLLIRSHCKYELMGVGEDEAVAMLSYTW